MSALRVLVRAISLEKAAFPEGAQRALVCLTWRRCTLSPELIPEQGGDCAPFANPRAFLHRVGFEATVPARSSPARHGIPCPLVRHATPADLERIDHLLEALRSVSGLVEKRPGVFYRRARAFVHFHADPTGLFADARLRDDDFVRLPVTTQAEQTRFLRQVRRAVGEEG